MRKSSKVENISKVMLDLKWKNYINSYRTKSMATMEMRYRMKMEQHVRQLCESSKNQTGQSQKKIHAKTGFVSVWSRSGSRDPVAG
jgi:zona occludens toxin (predicted ATPase)